MATRTMATRRQFVVVRFKIYFEKRVKEMKHPTMAPRFEAERLKNGVAINLED